MTDEELDAKLADTRKELFNLRFQSATGALENTRGCGTRSARSRGS